MAEQSPVPAASDPYGLLGQVPTLAQSSMLCAVCHRSIFGTCDKVDGVVACAGCSHALAQGTPIEAMHLALVALVTVVSSLVLAFVWLRLRVTTRLELAFMPLVIGEGLGRLVRLLSRRRRSVVLPLLAGLGTYSATVLVRLVGILLSHSVFLSLRDLNMVTDDQWQAYSWSALSAPVASGPNMVVASVLLIIGVCEAARVGFYRPKVEGPLHIAQVLAEQRAA